MTKSPRVSVKGKGADIFFGDFGGTQTPIAPQPEATPLPEPETAMPLAGNDASKKASMQESKIARTQARERRSAKKKPVVAEAEMELPPNRALLGVIWQPVAERATITNAFRYTEQDLSLLEDTIYDIHKKHKAKLTKQEIARLGLNAVLWDYQLNGEASLLGEFIQKRKQQAEGEI